MSDDLTTVCTVCVAGTGSPNRVILSKGLQTVYYHCPTCGRTWETASPIQIDSLFGSRGSMPTDQLKA